MYIYFILRNIFSCIGIGLFMAVLMTGIVYVICTLMDAKQTLGSILTMIGCFIVSFFVGIRLVGAYYAKGFVDECFEMCNVILNNAGESADSVLASDLPELISEEYPSISVIFDYFTFTKGSPAQGLMDYVESEVNDYLLWSWIWLIVVFVIVAVLSYLLAKKSDSASSSYRDRGERRSPRSGYERERVHSNRRRR